MSFYEKIKYSVKDEALLETWNPYLKRIMLDILEYLESLVPEYKEDQMFVDGESDSNQTEFERKSNNIEIGAKSHTNISGHILLFFMRMIIDDNPNILSYALLYYAEEQDVNSEWNFNYRNGYLTIKDILEPIKQEERTYTTITPISKEAKMTLVRRDPEANFEIVETHICKKAEEIDLWDINRVRKELETIT